MRRNTEANDNFKDEEGYELQGWTNDLDDLVGHNNLLRTLEKKITFPLLDSQRKSKKLSKKLETLPAVFQNPKPRHEIYKVHKNHDVHLSPIMSVQKPKKLETEASQQLIQTKIKNTRTQKIRLNAMPIATEASQPTTNFIIRKQKNKSVKNLNQSYLHFYESIKNTQENKTPHKNLQSNLKIQKKKHHKMPSVESFSVKTKLAIFQEHFVAPRGKDETKEHPKMIRWDKFNVSRQATTINFHNNRETLHVTPQNDNSQQKNSQGREKSHQKSNSNQGWLYKMLTKTKTEKLINPHKKIVKPDFKNYFLDEHLQSPATEPRQSPFHR